MRHMIPANAANTIHVPLHIKSLGIFIMPPVFPPSRIGEPENCIVVLWTAVFSLSLLTRRKLNGSDLAQLGAALTCRQTR
jgi:hypothetical protein